jgi:uncharacterized membrane protein
MKTTRGLDRLVFFTDAVTAIAITLLILPLVDSVERAAGEGHSAAQFIGDDLSARRIRAELRRDRPLIE